MTGKDEKKRKSAAWPIAIVIIVLALIAFGVYLVEQKKAQKKGVVEQMVGRAEDVGRELAAKAQEFEKALAALIKSADKIDWEAEARRFLERRPQTSDAASGAVRGLAQQGRSKGLLADTQVPPPSSDDTTGVQALRATVDKMRDHAQAQADPAFEAAANVLAKVANHMRDGSTDPKDEADIFQAVSEFLKSSGSELQAGAAAGGADQKAKLAQAHDAASQMLDMLSKQLGQGGAGDSSEIAAKVKAYLQQQTGP